ncbi:hypothetical protein HaLaN_16780, partial [Haematococcus lacustris]
MFAFEPAEKHSQVAAIVSQEQGRQRKGAAEGVGLGPAGMEMRPPAPEPWRPAPSQPRPLPEGAIQVKGSRAARARELLLLQSAGQWLREIVMKREQLWAVCMKR